MKLGYGTYGMPDLSVPDAVKAVKSTGYDGVELCCTPGAPASPEKLDREARRQLKEQLRALELECPALMLSLNAVKPDQTDECERLRAACGLAVDISSTEPPVMVTTTGGPASKWETEREHLVASIGRYADIALEAGLVLAIEPHVGGALHRPEQAEWVRQQVGSDAVKFNYDESHFQLRGLPIEQSAAIMVPHAVATHMKDAEGDPEHVVFMLPGEGDFDYVSFFCLLDRLGYDGYLTVEVSGMVWKRPDYNAIAAAQFCYRTLAGALAAAGLKRG